jgi:hypothetical protein
LFSQDCSVNPKLEPHLNRHLGADPEALHQVQAGQWPSGRVAVLCRNAKPILSWSNSSNATWAPTLKLHQLQVGWWLAGGPPRNRHAHIVCQMLKLPCNRYLAAALDVLNQMHCGLVGRLAGRDACLMPASVELEHLGADIMPGLISARGLLHVKLLLRPCSPEHHMPDCTCSDTYERQLIRRLSWPHALGHAR